MIYTEPGGTPVSRKQGLDKEPFHVKGKVQFIWYDVNQVTAEPVVPSLARREENRENSFPEVGSR